MKWKEKKNWKQSDSDISQEPETVASRACLDGEAF